jgi:hypothetical protein
LTRSGLDHRLVDAVVREARCHARKPSHAGAAFMPSGRDLRMTDDHLQLLGVQKPGDERHVAPRDERVVSPEVQSMAAFGNQFMQPPLGTDTVCPFGTWL